MDGSSICSTIHFVATIGRHASAPPAFQGSAFAPASSLRCGGRLRRPSNRAYVASGKSILGFSRGSEIRFANLRAAKSRLHALFVYWQERIKHACKEKSFCGFFLDCRSQGLLHVANPPSMARYSLARKNKTCLQENPSMAQYSLARNKSVPCTRSAASSGPSKGTFPKKRHLLNGGVLPCLLLQFL